MLRFVSMKTKKVNISCTRRGVVVLVSYPVLDPFESRQFDTLEFIGHLLEPNRLFRIRVPCTYSIPFTKNHIQVDFSPSTCFPSPVTCNKNERCVDNRSPYRGDRSDSRQKGGGSKKEI